MPPGVYRVEASSWVSRNSLARCGGQRQHDDSRGIVARCRPARRVGDRHRRGADAADRSHRHGPHHREHADHADAAGVQPELPGAARSRCPARRGRSARIRSSTTRRKACRATSTASHGRSTTSQLEGADNSDNGGSLAFCIPSAEAIETVSVTTSNYDAEFGRAGGAVTNVTIKSGTNHLAVRVHLRQHRGDDVAQPFTTLAPADSKYMQAGFTFGGPIKRNKLFFFGDYVRTSDDSGRLIRGHVPEAAFRNGDFSAAPTHIYDPSTGDADGSGRTPFANNQIPADRISPIALEPAQQDSDCRTSPARRLARSTTSNLRPGSAAPIKATSRSRIRWRRTTWFPCAGASRTPDDGPGDFGIWAVSSVYAGRAPIRPRVSADVQRVLVVDPGAGGSLRPHAPSQ